MKKKILKIIVIILLVLIVIFGILYLIDNNRMKNNEPVLFSTWGKQYTSLKQDEEKNIYNNSDMDIILSLEDNISDNSAWCGTFNLIWNDLKNDLAKQDIVFSPQLEVVQNLNKGTFNTSYLSENSYYKIYGTPTLELKEKIEKEIKEKFNETSDILDDFDWRTPDPEDYFLYAMLKKEFEFEKEFTQFDNGQFRDYENAQYFGVNNSTNEEVRKQVQVLYYNSENDFAIKLLTKTDDEVIISKGNVGNTFINMYENIKENSEKYDGTKSLSEDDIVKIPNITFNLKKEFEELQNKPFLFSNGDEYIIEKAMQTIKFELDKKGGKIKSEAGMMVRKEASIIQEPRNFIIDDTFTIFLKEKGKDLPYFASKISDISKVQEQVKKVSEEKQEKSFFGNVIESDLNYILVEPNEGEDIRNSTDKVYVKLEDNYDMIYPIDTNVKITYTGDLKESYPVEINATNIEVKSVDDFEIIFIKNNKQGVIEILDKNEIEDYSIYSYRGNVNIVIDGQTMELRDALLNDKITMEEIIQKANKDLEDKKITGDIYKDGGSRIYKYDDYTIIKCHSLDGNRDVYIGVPEMILSDVM